MPAELNCVSQARRTVLRNFQALIQITHLRREVLEAQTFETISHKEPHPIVLNAVNYSLDCDTLWNINKNLVNDAGIRYALPGDIICD